MSKSPEMEAFLDNFSQSALGSKRSTCLDTQTCVTCGEYVSGFRDALSVREYKISGMCQKCQDSVFGE